MPSIYKLFQGNKRLNPKSHLPLIVIVAHKDKGSAFSEHYAFTGLDEPACLLGSTGYSTGRELSEPDFDKVISLDNLIATQLDHAAGHLENTLFEMDKDPHISLFWDGHNFEYRLVEDEAFTQLALNGKCKKEIAEMFRVTMSQALDRLEHIWKYLRKIEIKLG